MSKRPPAELSEALYFQIFDVKPGKKEARKIRIVEAIIDTIAKSGFDGMTFEAVGKRVGMQRAHVNYYFATRNDLVKTAVRYAVALGQEITIAHVQKTKAWEDRLAAVVEGPFEWIAKYPKHMPVMMLFYHLCTVDEDYKQLQNIIRTRGEERIRATLEPLVLRGQLENAKANEVARSIQALMAGALIYLHNSDYGISATKCKTQTVETAQLLVKTAISD